MDPKVFSSVKILYILGRIIMRGTAKEDLKGAKYAPTQSGLVQTKGLQIYAQVKIIGS